MAEGFRYVRWLETVTSADVPLVGGKNASLGEMIGTMREKGVEVPGGFAVTSEGYRSFLAVNELEGPIEGLLAELERGKSPLGIAGRTIRSLFSRAVFPADLEEEIRRAYRELCSRHGSEKADVAVRSSATAEDLPEASFAGQQESFLNVTGEEQLLEACRNCYASLFTDRAISYRREKGFDHMKVALSVGVQNMVRSDTAGAGVMFSIDTETGFPHVVVINAAWGLGENVVQGAVTPDEYMVFKPLLDREKLVPIIEKTLGGKAKKLIYAIGGKGTTRNVETSRKERMSFVLSDEEIVRLARWGVAIEEHYGRPMDMEWAKDGETGRIYIVQARPETVQARRGAAVMKSFSMVDKGEVLVTGLAIGEAIAAGKAQVIRSAAEIDHFREGRILVTGMTDPDWVPIMKKAGGIVTDFGGRTSHAAIVSRELGIPAVVGTGDATQKLRSDTEITMSCAEGDQGRVYRGILRFDESEANLEDLPETKTAIMMNIADPAAAFRWWRLPCKGVGLARMEFIINNIIKIHPMALVRFERLQDRKASRAVEELTEGYGDKTEYFVDHLARGIARIAASRYPHQVIVRMSDFKTNEYANLIGGKEFEPGEENPMLGFRGASRYYSERYREGFALECRAIKRVREEIGLTNVVVMIPFCRTVREADRVLEVMAENGLVRGEQGLEIYVMAEIPSNIVLAERFAERFDGFSIGSNDLTQLILGVDRDSAELAGLFDERNEAVMEMIKSLIRSAGKSGTKVGICGQAPSDYPDFAEFLVREGIDSISLNPDSVISTLRRVAEVEQRGKRDK